MAEYGEEYEKINFCTANDSAIFEKKRIELINSISKHTSWGYCNTKTDCNNLSEGCRLCGEGLWSCLFINGRCNAKCFYCPAPQNEDCLPTTNTVNFSSAAEYVAYLKRFGFKGVSISGGEPLLTPELTFSYIKAVREAFGDEMYIWMYTNGLLVTEHILDKLKCAGLNEIRFDIGATGYSLSNLSKAIGKVPVVTVEIPAVPEEIEQLKIIVKQLAELGVNHLNLHQLRLTPTNFEKMMQRNYTYIHNESVPVIESELTALQIIDHTLQNNIKLPINYCSYPYKNRFQGVAARKRNCTEMVKLHEEVTENGYIRLITLKGDETDIMPVAGAMSLHTGRYELSRDKKTLCIHPSLINLADISKLDLMLSYFSAKQLQSMSYKNPFKTIQLTSKKNIVIERFRASNDITLSIGEAYDFIGFMTDKTCTPLPPAIVQEYEIIKQNLLEYL